MMTIADAKAHLEARAKADEEARDEEARKGGPAQEVARLRAVLKHIADNTHDPRTMAEADAALAV